MRAVHRHTILRAHLDGAIGPGRRNPYDDAKIPFLPAGEGDVLETELIAGPVLGGVSFLKKFALLLVEIHPGGDGKRLMQVEIRGLAEIDFTFTSEFSGLTGRPIFIGDFTSNELSVVARESV